MAKIKYIPLKPFEALVKPYRYKVYYGGRGSAKSYNFALTLLVLASKQPLRILCAREFQNSISDSVHRLLSDLIDKYHLPNFEVTQREIRNKLTGSEFIFKGLRHNIQSIKSTEGVDICWVEEAQTVSEESWQILIPTIRKPGSEIWVSFNPYFVEDPTYQRFVVNPPSNAFVKKVTYKDNPYFPDVLREEMEYDKKTDYERYMHVWEGECITYSDAQVFRDKFAIDTIDVGNSKEVYYGADWGFAVDPTTLVRVWVVGEYLYIDQEAYKVGCTLDDTPSLFDKIVGSRSHIIRADSSRPETINFLNSRGFTIKPAPKWPGSVEDGIEFMKSFKKIIINPNCKHTAEEFRLYSYKTNSAGDILPQLEDKNNHCIDAIRYALSPLIRKRSSAKSMKIGLI
ncbi:PBSX family phage terminase large subunit [Nitratiruptor sp. SB155-2]|uniref:PBSX family phage terminase large subunit n=1 Tax=Nitratiruptor sp. (strain SB155-2) TaxID=387092 RepID=UPI0001586F50|nr:PBSX family phage terminase large subunit [Nitratiruptor sp. SB155-2]BAF69579.1 phage terminase, large subunit [Nitratiruptor sp. SB155-2]BAN05340.1 terminase large subunit [Nitratiruptor phage NrS-1]